MEKTMLQRTRHTIDASGKALGRVATEVATLLRGKHKPSFKLHIDVGDFVEVINLDKIKFTGNKLLTEVKYRHSQYPGGLKEEGLSILWKKNPKRVFTNAVSGMLPKNKLKKEWLKRLTIKDNHGNNE